MQVLVQFETECVDELNEGNVANHVHCLSCLLSAVKESIAKNSLLLVILLGSGCSLLKDTLIHHVNNRHD